MLLASEIHVSCHGQFSKTLLSLILRDDGFWKSRLMLRPVGRVIRDNDVWRVTERSCFDEFRENGSVEMLERSLRQRFLTLYWPYFPAGAVRARFSSPRLSISRISFYEIVTAYRTLCERLFFLKIEYFYRSLLPFSHVLFSIKEKLDRFFFVLFVSF